MSRIALVVVASCLALLSGCSRASDLTSGGATNAATTSGTPTAESTTGPTTGPTTEVTAVPAPPEDACYNLAPADMPKPTNDDADVPCTKTHTAQTFHVGRWSKSEVATAKDVGDESLGAAVGTDCDRAFNRLVGGDQQARDISLVQWAWFKPTQKQFDEGAHWFRCDLVAGESGMRELAPLPADVAGLLDRPLTDAITRCFTTRFTSSGKDAGRTTSCAEPHAQRAISSFRVGATKAPYPGRDAVRSQSSSACQDRAQAYLDYPKTYSWGYTWPEVDQWKLGDRFTTCWAVTSR